MTVVNTFPPWIKKTLSLNEMVHKTRSVIMGAGARTVCETSLCPNLNECFSKGHVTFIILGPSCTRSCSFCASGPHGPFFSPDPEEGERILNVVRTLSIHHVIITSVTRDDLPDGGSSHYGVVIEDLRAYDKGLSIELLVPDFNGNRTSVERVASYRPAVFGHNIETVPRLYPSVRGRLADYSRSLDVLRWAKESQPGLITKSAMLLGFGEELDEVIESMRDLRSAGCDMLMIGQYLRPSGQQISVKRFVEPEEFARLEEEGYKMGFGSVSSGPFVRSSYNIKEIFTA